MDRRILLCSLFVVNSTLPSIAKEQQHSPDNFTSNTNFMSYEGYLRWRYFQKNNVWVDRVGKGLWLKPQIDEHKALLELNQSLRKHPQQRNFSISYGGGDFHDEISYDRLTSQLDVTTYELEHVLDMGDMWKPLYWQTKTATDQDIFALANPT